MFKLRPSCLPYELIHEIEFVEIQEVAGDKCKLVVALKLMVKRGTYVRYCTSCTPVSI
jgi:hypothetical protein